MTKAQMGDGGFFARGSLNSPERWLPPFRLDGLSPGADNMGSPSAFGNGGA
jgi:hypothetical protein